jgi:hypothetical protein
LLFNGAAAVEQTLTVLVIGPTVPDHEEGHDTPGTDLKSVLGLRLGQVQLDGTAALVELGKGGLSVHVCCSQNWAQYGKSMSPLITLLMYVGGNEVGADDAP